MESKMSRENAAKIFAEYLQSNVRLDALETMTASLDEQLADSQETMSNIKAMFDLIPKHTDTESTDIKPEELSQILSAGEPRLLMPDMDYNTLDVDLDIVIGKMKSLAEELKNGCTYQQSLSHGPTNKLKELPSLDLDRYASSLDQLGKQLSNIKLSKSEHASNRNLELEDKLTKLCQDVKLFTQMVESKTTLCENNKNWSEIQHDNKTLYYNEVIDKLLGGITEVTYLLQNKN